MAHPLTDQQRDALASSFSPMPSVWVAHADDAPILVPVLDGTVTLDGGSQERTTLTMRVPLDYAPTSWDSPLTPDDARCAVLYGVGVGPQVRVATAWVDEVRVRRPDGYVDVTAYSRATRIAEAGFPEGDRRYTGTCVDVASRIATDALGSVAIDVQGGLAGPQVAAETIFDGDPWQAIEDLMDTAGGEAFFDADDVLVMRPVPKADPPVTHRLRVGPGGTITAYESVFTRAPNVLRMEFQNPTTGEDVVGRAVATGRAAPSGRYGTFRRTETRTGKVTQAEADRAADEYLTRAGGLMRNLTIECAPDPSIEVGDSTEVLFVSGTTEVHRITRVEFPLTMGEPMRVETRSLPWR